MIFLNLGSFVFGLIAWFLPIVNLAKRNKAQNKDWIIYSMSSIRACSISLYMQIIYQSHLVSIEDWSAIMDTSGGLVFVSSVFLATTLVLNMIALVLNMKKRQKI